MKIGGIEYGITEMTNTLLELWSCEFTIEGLQTITPRDAYVRARGTCVTFDVRSGTNRVCTRTCLTEFVRSRYRDIDIRDRSIDIPC